MKPYTTNSGFQQQLLALYGTGVNFTKIVIGNGDVPDNYLELTDLVNPLYDIGLDSLTVDTDSKYVLLTGTFSNTYVEDDFTWKEVGIFCTDPDGGDDLLYAYGHCDLDGSSSAVIPAAGDEIFEIVLKYSIYVGEASDITATLADSSNYATKAELKDHIEDVDNPHEVTAEQVGLGNVPNVTTNNQTPTYSTASSVTALVSGETLSTALGKIAKAISSLITHLADSTIHITSSERTTWNSKASSSHTHSASDITSGTLGASRGGTGVTSISSLWTTLWSSRNAYLTNNKFIYGYDTGSTARQLVGLDSTNDVVVGHSGSSSTLGDKLHLHSPGEIDLRTWDGSDDHYINVVDGVLYTNGNENLGTSDRRWGTVYCASYSTSSDKKLKTELGELENAKDFIMGLNPVAFYMSDDEKERPKTGFYAQDVHDLMLSLGITDADICQAGYSEETVTSTGKTKTVSHEDLSDDEIAAKDDADLAWGLDYAQFIAPMVKVMQEQDAKIEALEAEIAALKEG